MCVCVHVTFEALVASLALGAKLGALTTFVLIARPAHWESAFIASHKEISVHCQPYLVPAYLTHLPVQLLQWLWLHASITQTPPTRASKLINCQRKVCRGYTQAISWHHAVSHT